MLVRNPVTIDTRVRKEAKALQEAGYDVHVLGLRDPQRTMPEREELDGIPVQRLDVRVRPGLVVLWHTNSLTQRRRRTENRVARWSTQNRFGTAGAGPATPLVRKARSAGVRLAQGHVTARAKASVWTGAQLAKGRAAQGLVRQHIDFARAARPELARLRPDVVHAHDLDTLYAAVTYARWSGAKVVYDAHELERHRNAEWTAARHLIIDSLEKFGIRRADAVITVSEGIADWYAREYGTARPSVVLNSPPLSAAVVAGDPTEDLRGQLGLPADARVVAYVGKVTRGRGVETLVGALEHLGPDYHLVVLGPRESYDAQIERLATTAGVRERLHLLPPVPSATVPRTIATADVSATPIENVCLSYDLALPNKLFDSLYAGVPVVVSDLTEMAAFVREHEIGEVRRQGDATDFASGIAAVVAQRPKGLADADRLRALREAVSWETQAARLREVYARLAPLG